MTQREEKLTREILEDEHLARRALLGKIISCPGISRTELEEFFTATVTRITLGFRYILKSLQVDAFTFQDETGGFYARRGEILPARHRFRYHAAHPDEDADGDLLKQLDWCDRLPGQ